MSPTDLQSARMRGWPLTDDEAEVLRLVKAGHLLVPESYALGGAPRAGKHGGGGIYLPSKVRVQPKTLLLLEARGLLELVKDRQRGWRFAAVEPPVERPLRPRPQPIPFNRRARRDAIFAAVRASGGAGRDGR